jgi:hypothetical protein
VSPGLVEGWRASKDLLVERAMSYHGVGAGPGPVKTYKVDAPFPWGENTEIKIPVQQMADDSYAAVLPHILELEGMLINDVEDEMARVVPDLVQKVIEQKIRPELAKQMEIAFAKVDIVKDDAVKSAVKIAAGIAIAIGIGAWWVKRGG